MLPKIDVPIYELKLVSCREPIKFRPFLVKEQKLLLMAQEAIQSEIEEEKDTTLNAVKQVINNCVLSDINVNELPMFDIEYLFLNLRARSMGENIKLSFRCVNEIENENKEVVKCNNIVEVDMNILNVHPKISTEHSNKIIINEKLGLLMKYPNLNVLSKIDMDEQESVLQLIISCIDEIYDEENIYYAKDVEKKELEEFIDSLPTKIIEDIKKFFDTMPKIKEEVQFKCGKCQHEEFIPIEGLDSFFV
jgi:hypothetical protein